MKRSPLQLKNFSPEMQKLAVETKLMIELTRIHNEFNQGIIDLKQLATEARNLHMQGVQMVSKIRQPRDGEDGYTPKKGIDYNDGKDGYTPKKGVDYFDGNDGDTPEVDYEAIIARVLTEIRQPEDGKDAILDIEVLTNEVIENIRKGKKLKKEDIDGYMAEMASYRGQLAGKIYGKDTWARGSGTTVSAGANVTLVPQADGTVQINASGGGSGTNVATQYSLTAVQAGSDVTIDISQLTNFATFDSLIAVYRNNTMQTETLNFTFANPTITILNADAGEVFNCTYAYV